MNRNFKKFALVLVMLMLLAKLDGIQAVAAPVPGLKYPSRVVYIDGDVSDKYTDNCWIPSQNVNGYKVRYQVTKNADLISVSKNGKVTVTGNGIGAAVIKVTYSKTGEKEITANFTVKVRRNAVDVKLTQKSIEMLDTAYDVGDKVTLQAAKSYDGSYKKGHYGLDNYMTVISDQLKIESLTPSLLEINGMTLTAKAAGTAQFVVKAYQYGDNTDTNVKSKTYSMVIKEPVPDIEVKQTEANLFTIKTNQTFTSAPAVSSIKVNRADSNYKVDIKSVTVDSSDKTKLIIETYSDMVDGAKYKVAYNNDTYEFQATDGKVAEMDVTPKTVEANIATEINLIAYDKNKVIVGRYDMITAYDNSSIDFSIDFDNGYLSEDIKLVLYNEGDKATATGTYYTGEFVNGVEKTITKTVTITATKPSKVTSDRYQYTIASSIPDYTATSFTANQYIGVNSDTQKIYFYVKDSQGNDISHNYTFDTSNADVLLVDYPDVESKGVSANLYAFKATSSPVYVQAKNLYNNDLILLPVTIRAESKANKIELSQSSLTLSNAVDSHEVVQVMVYDQFGTRMDNEIPDVECISTPSGASYAEGYETDTGQVVFNASGMSIGTYRYRIGVNNYSQVLTLVVKAPDERLSSSYRLVVSPSVIDTAITTADDYYNAKEVRVYLAEYKGDVIKSYYGTSGVDFNVVDSRGYSVNYHDDGEAWLIPVIDSGASTVQKLSVGTYRVTAKAPTGTSGRQTTYQGTFTVKDTQGGVSCGLKKNTVEYGYWIDVLQEAFSFNYKGTNVGGQIYEVTYKTSSGTTTSAYAYETASTGTYNIVSVTLDVEIDGWLTVPMTVEVNRTITVK